MIHFQDAIKNISKVQRSIDSLLELGEITRTDTGIKMDSAILNTIYEEDATIGVCHTKEVGDRMSDHLHKSSVQYLIVIKGQLSVRIGNIGFRILKTGDCCSIPVGEIHSITALEPDTKTVYINVPPEEGYGRSDVRYKP